MKPLSARPLLKELRDSSQPTDAQLTALEQRIKVSVGLVSATPHLTALREASDPGAVRRIHQRLQAPPPPPRRMPLIVAAVVLLVVGVLLGRWSIAPLPPAPPIALPAPPPQPPAQPLEEPAPSPAPPQEDAPPSELVQAPPVPPPAEVVEEAPQPEPPQVEAIADTLPPDAPPPARQTVPLRTSAPPAGLLDGVAVTALDGRGSASIGSTDAVIDWQSGQLALEVAPGQGLAVTIQTEEATVEVIGTRFSVLRDHTGTITAVERGKVSVTCHGSPARLLEASQSHHCTPTTGIGWRNWLNHLRESREPASRILSVAGQALQSGTLSERDRVMVLIVQLEARYNLRDYPEAVDLGREIAAEAGFAQLPQQHREKAIWMYAAASHQLGDCDAAAVLLEQISQLRDLKRELKQEMRKTCR